MYAFEIGLANFVGYVKINYVVYQLSITCTTKIFPVQIITYVFVLETVKRKMYLVLYTQNVLITIGSPT